MASQWPPRSPHEALVSTPGGRERLRRLAERTSPSPSPTRLASRPASARAAVTARRTANGSLHSGIEDLDIVGSGGGVGGGDDDDDDEDEETLQLKLQAIQARLKLKKLQAAKAQKTAAAAAATPSSERSSAKPEPAPLGLPLQSRLAAARDRMANAESHNAIQVPASPVKKAVAAPAVETSPKRILLGIDKGLRAADVSLKRAPSFLRPQRQDGGLQQAQPQQQQHPQHPQQPRGGYLHKSRPTTNAIVGAQPRPASFNERLASARVEEASRQEKQERISQIRSNAFSVGRQEMEQYKSQAVELPDLPARPEEFSREEVLASLGRRARETNEANLPGGPFTLWEGARDDGGATPPLAGVSSKAAAPQRKKKVPPAEVPEAEATAFEPYSGFHLSKRILPHTVLTRAITGKKTFMIKDLLRCVTAPNWCLPDVEQDVVVFAIVASKSDPRQHKPGPAAGGGEGKTRQQDRGKYMVMTLVDLNYELDLFLFHSGFDRFWKLTTGTLIAILNPIIMAPPRGREATCRFSLVVNSDADTILEIGTARDLGYCQSVKRDGKLCSSWVNAKKTQYCEFHTNEAVRKTRSGRLELNGTSFGGSGGEGSKYGAAARTWRPPPPRPSEEEKQRGHYDRATQSRWFISGAAGRAGGLLDDEREGGLADRAEREEALKRRLAQQERERNIAKQLGKIGAGAGKEYMSHAASAAAAAATAATAAAGASSQSSSQPASLPGAPERRVDVRELIAPKGERRRIDLSSVKRKRPESSSSSVTPATAGGDGGGKGAGGAGLGWGVSLKDKLSRMKDGEKLDGSRGTALLSAEEAAAKLGLTPRGGAAAVAAIPPADASRARADGSPVRKKTRFVTEKGIREAGRESLGEPLSAASAAQRRQVVLDDDDDDDDDDDLIIVK
ncbi:hypothetical protein VTK73DRAFT_9326 [Phialemonium thermophilum]|uniref:Zinc finger Mcm10/DnaG-type domain-containing protein n=1 Tax=Phialemonium thermophilum TaxID=223376 RepID=A0ABR3W303_9PEZI